MSTNSTSRACGWNREVRLKLRITADGSLDFLRGQSRPTLGWSVGAVPKIAREAEAGRGRPGADIDSALAVNSPQIRPSLDIGDTGGIDQAVGMVGDQNLAANQDAVTNDHGIRAADVHSIGNVHIIADFESPKPIYRFEPE